MKSNDIKALAKKSREELSTQLSELQVQLAKAKLQKAAGKLANTSLPSRLQDDIARVKTNLTLLSIKEKNTVQTEITKTK